ncbi:MAG: type II toxin-antitoxin system RelE/ParE family toxin [Methylobacter sp.]
MAPSKRGFGLEINLSQILLFGNCLHPLAANLAGHYAVTVNGNWRITFSFDGDDVELVDYLDYH